LVGVISTISANGTVDRVNALSSAGSGCTFNLNRPLDFNGDEVPDAYVLHGFLVVDATIGGKPYRFVNAQFENGYVDGSPGVIQSAQAFRILQATAGTPAERRLIIVGDMNSDPSDAVDPTSPIPATPYTLFAGAGLFDVWLRRPAGPQPLVDQPHFGGGRRPVPVPMRR